VPARVPRTSGRVPVNGSVNHLLPRTGAGAPLPGQAALGLLGLLSLLLGASLRHRQKETRRHPAG
jgi:hypothetical protein